MKKLFLFVFAALAFAACEQAPIEEQSAVLQDATKSITVGFEGDDDTRIQLNEAQKTVWTEGDHVSVFYRSSVNEEWQFMGETGDRTGQIVPVDNSVNPPATHNHVVVIYPYNKEYYLNTEKYSIEASLPAVQNYLEDSYGTNGNIMVSSSDYKQVSLKSVCGWLKLQLTGDGEVVKSITLRGNNGEQVAGELHIYTSDATCVLASASGDAGDGEVGGTLVRPGTILTEVTLDCGEGVALGKNATAFYIALPPQTFEKGFKVEIEDTEGYIMEQSTDKALLIERNTIKPMAAFEFINPATPSAPAPASNEIWYTATAKVEPSFDDSLTFGADVVSNVWDSETKRGIIAFDGDVTMIGLDAFNNCDKLTGVTLPECVTSIGKQAFYDCDGLTEFTIPDSVTEIGSSAFYGCDKLTIVTISDSVTTIGSSAFYSCKSLKEFKGKYATEDGRSLIVDNTIIAYANASGTTYTIPDSITTIGNYAFYYCTSLTSVNIPDSVTTIGERAFYWCTSLKQVYCYATIPPSLGNDVFYNNASGRRIYVYEECVELYKSAWSSYKDSIYTNGENCPETTTIQYTTNNGNTITSSKLPIISNIYENGVGTLVYSGKEIPSSAFRECTNLISVNIPDSVTEIGEYAFSSCDSLTSVTIGDSVTEIGSYAFYECTSLTSVNIPDSVTTIGVGAFSYCDSLTSVNIPDSVTTIGNSAFYNCTSLKSVYCKATTPPALGYDSFKYWNLPVPVPYGCDIYVPVGSVEAYKSATRWSEYASSIVGYDFENGVVVE